MSLGREVLTIKIKLSETKSDVISVHERDEPHILASKFCQKHKLPENYEKAVSYLIDKNLDILIDEELRIKSPELTRKDMYTKGIEQKEKTKAKLERIRSELDSKELPFRPSLSPSLSATSSPRSELSRAQKLSNILKVCNQSTFGKVGSSTMKVSSVKPQDGFSLNKTVKLQITQPFELQPYSFPKY